VLETSDEDETSFPCDLVARQEICMQRVVPWIPNLVEHALQLSLRKEAVDLHETSREVG